MALAILILLLVCIVMPLALAWRIWRLDEPSRAGWLAVTADAAVFVLLILIVGRWDIAGHWTRFLLAALLTAAALASWLRHRGRPWRGTRPLLRSHTGTLLSLALFGAALVYVASGLLPRSNARPLAFPLAGGTFMVAHGGGNVLLNHHATHPEQRHALDIGAVGAAGFRAPGVLPADNARYAIYGKPVLAPCDGEVIAATDGLPDQTPPEMDPENPRGNHVTLACGGMAVELAHLRPGSLLVRPGAQVFTGQQVAEAGNSGNTTEPHLHIHATDAASGAAVALTFDGRTPVRNRVFRRP